MSSFSMLFVFLAIVLSGGGGNDLLDYLPTGAYWKAKGVAPSVEAMVAELKPKPERDAGELIKGLGAEDFAAREAASAGLRALGPGAIPQLRAAAESSTDEEVRTRAKALITELTVAVRAGHVRRLMAIRTLGELKKPEALAELRPLADSREPFVADYARAAMAAIEGKPHVRPSPGAEELASDVWMLPKGVGMVAQVTLPPGRPVALEAAFKQMVEMPGVVEKVGDVEQAKTQVAGAVMGLAERIGNVRIDGVTAGVAEDVGDRTGYVVFVVRGSYEPAAVRAAFGQLGGVAGKVDGAEVVSFPKPSAVLLTPSAQRLVAVMGPDEGATAPAVKDLLAALKAGKGALSENGEMAALVKAVQAEGRMWATARVSEAYRQAPLMAGFDSLTLTGRESKDGTELKLIARGRDAEKIKAAVAMFEEGRARAAEEIKRQAELMAFLKPFADLVGSIKVDSRVGEVEVRGRLNGQASPAVLALPWLMIGRAAPEAVPVPEP